MGIFGLISSFSSGTKDVLLNLQNDLTAIRKPWKYVLVV